VKGEKMKKRMLLTFSLTFISVFIFAISLPASEQENKDFSFNAGTSVLSKYVWRGCLITDGAVLQPTITAGYKSLSLNAWGNMDFTDDAGYKNKFKEFDYTLDYSFDFNKFSFSTGAVDYTFPDTGVKSTTEIYAGAIYNMIGSPSLKIYQDVKEVKGTYFSLGGGYSFPIGEITSLDLSGALGFATAKHNKCYYFTDNSGLTDLFIGAGFPFKAWGNISIIPSAAFSSLINSDIRDAYDKAKIDTENFIFGITVSADF
jgi:hypothetical protein